MLLSEFSRTFARNIEIMGAISWDPGRINHEVIKKLKVNEKDTFLKIVFLNKFLVNNEIKKENSK